MKCIERPIPVLDHRRVLGDDHRRLTATPCCSGFRCLQRKKSTSAGDRVGCTTALELHTAGADLPLAAKLRQFRLQGKDCPKARAFGRGDSRALDFGLSHAHMARGHHSRHGQVATISHTSTTTTARGEATEVGKLINPWPQQGAHVDQRQPFGCMRIGRVGRCPVVGQPRLSRSDLHAIETTVDGEVTCRADPDGPVQARSERGGNNRRREDWFHGVASIRKRSARPSAASPPHVLAGTAPTRCSSSRVREWSALSGSVCYCAHFTFACWY